MDPYIGQIQAFGFDYAPMGWQFCQGQLLNISDYQALFALIGTTFGGNGSTTFAMPDLKARTVVGIGTGAGLSPVTLGQKAGIDKITLLTTTSMPAHNHTITNGDGTTLGTVKVTTKVTTLQSASTSNESDGGNNGMGTAGTAMPTIYQASPSGADFMGGVSSSVLGTTVSAGTNTAFSIRNPYVGLNYCIAVEGLWPPRDY